MKNSSQSSLQIPHKPISHFDFHLSASLSPPSAAADTVGAIEFNPTNTTQFATAGISRKIRIYNLPPLLSQPPPLDPTTSCHFYICTPAKLSSLRWKPGSGRILGAADYDGVVTEYDLEHGTPVLERDEHGGKRVWSMDYSQQGSSFGASGSDDGTMQMWDPRCDVGNCVAKVRPSSYGSPVCCVEFNPYGGALLAVGCADRKAYGYDVRRMVEPVMIFDGHDKTVSYTRFLDDQTVVTAGTDGCLKMWDTGDQRLVRTYKGHTNQRRFVGLSIWRHQGLIGSGSESNELFVYDKRWGEPIWVHGFEPAGASAPGFVSSVCWSQEGEDGCTLVGAGSDGHLKIFSVKKKLITNK